MVFSSPVFLFWFLPACLALYFLVPRHRLKNAVLTIFSLAFYIWGEGYFSAGILLSIGINYYFGKGLAQVPDDEAARTRIATRAVIANLVILGIYKYTNFLIDNVNVVFSIFSQVVIPHANIRMPIGVSFFTFQALSYVLDVKRRIAKPQLSLHHLTLYISLFPQLVAGPIVRYTQIERALSHRSHNLSEVAAGVERFIVGLFKKIVIANTMAPIADKVFALPNAELSISLAWTGALAYTLQIYFDFSGYSDMAIGLGRVFGFDFGSNFNQPYSARSITDFWRRWHISLTSWFRDYLYTPSVESTSRWLKWAGPTGSKTRKVRLIAFVFLVSGLWHGASWTFVAWGLFHGTFRILEGSHLGKRILQKTHPYLAQAYTLGVVLVGWIIFRATSLTHAGNYTMTLLGLTSTTALEGAYPIPYLLNPEATVILVLSSLWSIWRLEEYPRWVPSYSRVAGVLGTFVVTILFLATQTHNPFIYFRF